MKPLIAFYILSLTVSAAFAQAPETTTFIIMRHAEKDTVGADPMLNEKGIAEAQCAGRMFSSQKIDVVYSTPFNRTRETANEIATLHNMSVEEYNPFIKDITKQWLEKHRGKTIVVLGHSNTVPLLVNSLLGSDSIKPMSEEEYGKIFTIVIQENTSTLIELQIPCTP